jgi:UDP-2-acetamido-3-amino-2,3-dideoxy-glucuronate N-acetyltransferase
MNRVAVVGAGAWGANLVRNFHALEALALICDTDPRRLSALAKDYPGVARTDDFREVLRSREVRGVVIATPAATHHALARRALLESDLHVFVEKPLALTEAQGAELVSLAAERGRILMVGHVLQYHPALGELRRLVAEGALGKIHYIYSTRVNTGKIRSEENILWSFAPHDVSVMLGLLDETPSAVRAWGGAYLQRDVADVTMTVLDFPSGARGHVFVSWLHPLKEQKLVVVGDRQMAVFDDLAESKLVLYPHVIEWRARQPVAVKGTPRAVEFEPIEPLRAECRHFLECLRDGTPPRTDGKEGLRVLTVLEAGQRSLERGGEAVPLGGESRGRGSDVDPTAFVHETAIVDPGARIGARTKIWHFAHVLSGSTVGSGCSVGQNVMIGPDVTVGDGCKIQNNVSLYKGVTLEDQVFCGPSMVFTNVQNPRAAIARMGELRPTTVRHGATIGANATIVCGTTIGRHAFVGAGAVVTRSVADHSLVVGNPARHVGWMCECGVRLADTLACACGKRYRTAGEAIARAE